MNTLLRERRARQNLRRPLSRGDFDADWYGKTYPDVLSSKQDPLEHYLSVGWKQARFPNPLFDTGFYLHRNPDVAARGLNPLIHYVIHGAAEGRAPNPWFDTGFYLGRVGSLRGGETAVAHYLRQSPGARVTPAAALDLAPFRDRGDDAYCAFLHSPDAVRHGWLGDCVSTYATGWACRNAGPDVVLTIRVDGVDQGAVRPWIPRDDIAALGLNPIAGFFFRFPKKLAPGAVIEAFDERGVHLLGSPRVYAVPPLAPELGFVAARAAIAHNFLRGAGLEIGAFTQPTDVGAAATVEYYDKFPPDILRGLYDENWGRPLVEPQYHGDAQTLEGLPDGKTFDFVIAKHVIEHLEDPLLFLKTLASVIKPGGRAFLAAPNMRFTFDAKREPTSFEHLASDHREGAQRSRKAHYQDWAERVDDLVGDAAASRAEKLDREDFSIHFHVWTETTFGAFLASAIDAFGLPFSPLLAFNANHEIVVVLART